MEEKDDKKRWSIEVNKDGKRFSICTREVENGYVTRVTEEDNGDGNWEYNEKEYISKSNPLSGSAGLGKNVDKDEAAKIKMAVQSLKTLL